MLLLRVGHESAGNYSCSSHQSNAAVVSINVVDGKDSSTDCTINKVGKLSVSAPECSSWKANVLTV